jgi:hypothetical protein
MMAFPLSILGFRYLYALNSLLKPPSIVLNFFSSKILKRYPLKMRPTLLLSLLSCTCFRAYAATNAQDLINVLNNNLTPLRDNVSKFQAVGTSGQSASTQAAGRSALITPIENDINRLSDAISNAVTNFPASGTVRLELSRYSRKSANSILAAHTKLYRCGCGLFDCKCSRHQISPQALPQKGLSSKKQTTVAKLLLSWLIMTAMSCTFF